nr:MAG TPA: hypothetical protein [Caudoviricetes sp.]
MLYRFINLVREYVNLLKRRDAQKSVSCQKVGRKTRLA